MKQAGRPGYHALAHSAWMKTTLLASLLYCAVAQHEDGPTGSEQHTRSPEVTTCLCARAEAADARRARHSHRHPLLRGVNCCNYRVCTCMGE